MKQIQKNIKCSTSGTKIVRNVTKSDALRTFIILFLGVKKVLCAWICILIGMKTVQSSIKPWNRYRKNVIPLKMVRNKPPLLWNKRLLAWNMHKKSRFLNNPRPKKSRKNRVFFYPQKVWNRPFYAFVSYPWPSFHTQTSCFCTFCRIFIPIWY